jgi:hypothetical protein
LKEKGATYITGLDEVASSEQILLIWRNLDVVGTDNGLVLLGVIQSDYVVNCTKL